MQPFARNLTLTIAVVCVLVASAVVAAKAGPGILESVGTRSDTVATVLGWLPLGGFVILLGALAWWREAPGGRSFLATAVQAVLLALWGGVAFWFFPGRGSSYDDFSAQMSHGGPAFEHAATWTSYLPLPVLVGAFLAGMILSRGQRKSPANLTGLVGAVILIGPALVWLGGLLLLG